jgi:DNA-binding CsgD family transcriptional regulator
VGEIDNNLAHSPATVTRLPRDSNLRSSTLASVETRAETSTLSELELRVLRCASRGLSVTEAAAELNYSPAYVKQVRGAAMRKLDASGITGAVAEAMRRDLL